VWTEISRFRLFLWLHFYVTSQFVTTTEIIWREHGSIIQFREILDELKIIHKENLDIHIKKVHDFQNNQLIFFQIISVFTISSWIFLYSSHSFNSALDVIQKRTRCKIDFEWSYPKCLSIEFLNLISLWTFAPSFVDPLYHVITCFIYHEDELFLA
jgi:hypothetical protein